MCLNPVPHFKEFVSSLRRISSFSSFVIVGLLTKDRLFFSANRLSVVSVPHLSTVCTTSMCWNPVPHYQGLVSSLRRISFFSRFVILGLTENTLFLSANWLYVVSHINSVCNTCMHLRFILQFSILLSFFKVFLAHHDFIL